MKPKNILIRLIDFKISILTKLKNILLSCVIVFGSISLSGCYTQLAMFHPEPENDDSEEFYSYSVARVRPNLSLYANDGAGMSLGMAYGTMYNRFYGFNNRYSYYNPYYYGGIYNDYVSYNIYDGTYTVWIPGIKEKKQRTWTTDRSGTTTTNLNTTRTRTNHGTSQSSNSGYSNSSNVSSTRSSSGSTSSSSSSSSSGGTRVTKRN